MIERCARDATDSAGNLKDRRSRRLGNALIGIVALVPLLCCDAGSPTGVRSNEPVSPLQWPMQREPANPVIRYSQNPGESTAQYVPAPVLLPDGSLWAFVKGDDTGNISAYRSSDGGKEFVFIGTALERGPTGEWDSEYVHEPVVVFDQHSNQIHMWYKGSQTRGLYNRWSWGHATASPDAPADFIKDPTNPILTPADVEVLLNEVGVHDLAISDVVLIDSTFYFYGYFGSTSGYRLFYASGDSWNTPVPRDIILAPSAPFDLVQCPTVIRLHGQATFYMVYSTGYDADFEIGRQRVLKVAESSDGRLWQPLDGTLLAPDPTFAWEEKRVYCASFLKRAIGGFLDPELVDGRVLLFYSGSSNLHKDQVGLLYLTP